MSLVRIQLDGTTNTTDSRIGTYNSKPSVGNALRMLPTYYYLFDSLDVRRDVTCQPYITPAAGSIRRGANIASIYPGKFRREWISDYTESLNTTSSFGLNWPLIRFSDVLLMLAKADNELSHGTGPSTAAIAAAYRVALRGHNNNTTAYPLSSIPTSYTGFFDFLV